MSLLQSQGGQGSYLKNETRKKRENKIQGGQTGGYHHEPSRFLSSSFLFCCPLTNDYMVSNDSKRRKFASKNREKRMRGDEK